VADVERGAQAAAFLRMLLVRPGAPRAVWDKHGHHAQIDDEAVAEVLRQHDSGFSAENVRTALDGTHLTPATLELFIEAFDLTPRQGGRLRDLLRGSQSVRVVTGKALNDLYRSIGPPRHDTLAVHEMHTLGPDGLPAEHQTIQVIKSTVDSLDAYPLRFDTDELVVEVVRGGRVGDIYRVNESLYGVDIVLDRPLAKGETALMHYRTTFLYNTPPPPEFRRGVLGVMKDITLWVQFHPDRLPARVWLGRWDRLDAATMLEQQEVELDDEFSVQARYDEVEQSIVGFHWSWE
jgi:hypothetical protein